MYFATINNIQVENKTKFKFGINKLLLACTMLTMHIRNLWDASCASR